MELDVPVAQQSGEAAVLVYIDPARGSMEVLPTVARSTTSVRAVTTHLRADLLLGPAPASSSPLAGAQGLGSVTGYLVPVIHSMVQPAVSQLYDPSTSGWPIVDHGSAAIPDGFGPTIPATQVMASNLGIVPAAIVKGLSTAGFYADAGILASVQAAAHTPGITSDQMDALFSKFAGLPKDVRDEYVRQNLTASLALQGQPGFVALFNSATGPTASETWFATTVASSGVGVTLSQAAEPETGVLGHAANGFGTVLVKKAGDGPSTTVDGALPMSSFVFDYTKTSPVIETLKRFEGLTLDERRVVNDEVRAAFGLPKAVFETESVQGAGYTLHPGGAFIVRGDVFNVRLADPQTGLWIHDPNEGPAPGPGGVSIPYDDPNGRLDFVTLPGLPGFGVNVGSLVGLGGQDPLIRAITSITKATAPLVRQVAPEQVDIVSAPFKVTPDTALTATDSTVTFQADVPSPPAGGFRVRWDWGDGTTSDSVGSTGATHRSDPPGDYTATATLLSADGSRVLAVDTLQVKAPASPHWRLTWMEDTDTLGWSAVVPITVLLRDAIANPGSAMLSLDETSSGGTVLQLRVLAGGTWTTNNCCTRFAPALAGETRAPLGAMPSFVSPFGPLFNGYKATHWNQSTPDLGAGTMFGRANLGTFSYNVRNFGVQQGPQFVLQLEATRTGTTMVGTVSLIFWPIVDLLPNETIQYVELTPDFYRFNFLAERIR